MGLQPAAQRDDDDDGGASNRTCLNLSDHTLRTRSVCVCVCVRTYRDAQVPQACEVSVQGDSDSAVNRKSVQTGRQTTDLPRTLLVRCPPVTRVHMHLFALCDCPRAAAALLCNEHLCAALKECVQLYYGACIIRGLPLPEGVPRLNEKTKEVEWVPPYKQSHVNHPLTWWVAAAGTHMRWVLEHAEAIAERMVATYGTTPKAAHHLDVACATFRRWFVDVDMPLYDKDGMPVRAQMEAHEWMAFVPAHKRAEWASKIAAINPPRHCLFGYVAVDNDSIAHRNGDPNEDIDCTETYKRYYYKVYKPKRMNMTYTAHGVATKPKLDRGETLAPRKRAHHSCMGNSLEGCCGFM